MTQQPDSLEQVAQILASMATSQQAYMEASNERVNRIEQMVADSARAQQAQTEAREQDRQAFNERLDRAEQQRAQEQREFHERLDRVEQLREQERQESNERLSRIEQLVESNNRFLEAFCTKTDRTIERLDNTSSQLAAMIAIANEDRQQSKTQGAEILRGVKAIMRHFGIQ